jgi:RND family efflux transporter MFP subunit
MAFVVLLLSACGKKEEGTIGRGKKDDGSQAVMVELLQARDIDEYVNVSGKLEGITDITMSAESSGRILELYKKLGDYVEKGERIGRLENEVSRIRLGQAEAAFNAAETSLENAQKNLDYATLSRQRELISEAEFNTASAAFKSAKAGFDGAKAALEAARQAYENTYLMAPERGRISYLNVSAGQLINMGSPIATITDASTLLLKTGVGESQIAKIKTGQKAIVKHLGKNYSATVRGFGIRPMQGSSNYPIELVLGGDKSLLPGMVVSAKIKTNTFRDMLYTSITNVLKEFDRNYVFVVEKEGEKSIARQRDVVLGRSISEYVEIISGVEAGEEIVISGSENLEDGSLVKIRD